MGNDLSWERGSTRAWRKTRQLVLERDRFTCMLKLDGCTHRATHVHHTLGRGITADDPLYLVGACAHCNLVTGDPTKHDPLPEPRTTW